jgi:hypothetical protein
MLVGMAQGRWLEAAVLVRALTPEICVILAEPAVTGVPQKRLPRRRPAFQPWATIAVSLCGFAGDAIAQRSRRYFLTLWAPTLAA